MNRRFRAVLVGTIVITLGSCSTLPLTPRAPNAEVFEGGASLSGYQQETWLFDRVVITENGKDAIAARLRVIDRGANLTGKISGEDVAGSCTTFNGFTLDLDCKLFRVADGKRVAYLRVPLH